MDPLLRSRLQRLNADFAALDIEPGRAVWLACDLLLDGVNTPALCELAGESPTRLDNGDALDLLRQVLVELGLTPLSYEEAGRVLGRETARRVLAGAPRAEWEGDIWRITTQAGHRPRRRVHSAGPLRRGPGPVPRLRARLPAAHRVRGDHTVNAAIRDRLLRLNARLLPPDQAVWLACDLLVAGYETPALIELAGESPTQLRTWEADPLADRVLEELGIPRLSDEEQDWVDYRDLALDVISGKLTPDHWACCISPLGELGRPDELDELGALAVGDPDAVADRVLQFARECVRIVDERVGVRLP